MKHASPGSSVAKKAASQAHRPAPVCSPSVSGASSFSPSLSLINDLQPAPEVKRGDDQLTSSSIAAELGITIQKKNSSGGFNKDSRLKICKLPDAIVLRFEPENNRFGSWSEKEAFQAVRNKETWVGEIGIDDFVLQWHDKNKKIVNNKGHAVRLFVVYLEDGAPMPCDDALIKLGNFVCAKANQIDGNQTTASVGPDPFWPSSQICVWSDVIGVDAALRMSIKECGSLVPEFHGQNKNKLFKCFRSGELSMDLARLIHAPIEEVHPDLRPGFANEDCMKSAIAKDEKEKSGMLSDEDDDELQVMEKIPD